MYAKVTMAAARALKRALITMVTMVRAIIALTKMVSTLATRPMIVRGDTMMDAIHIVHPGYWVYSMPHSGFLASIDGGWGAKHQAGGDTSSPAFSIKVALAQERQGAGAALLALLYLLAGAQR
jgi:hypothetical protein